MRSLDKLHTIPVNMQGGNAVKTRDSELLRQQTLSSKKCQVDGETKG